MGSSRATPSVEAWARWAAREGVVDENVAQRRQLLGHRRDRSSSSPLWKRVFSSSSTSPSFSAATAASALGPMQSSAKATVRPTASDSGACSDLQRHGGHDLALGPVEMAEHDHPRALFGEFADGGRLALDARGVGHLAVLHRNVQVGAHQHALSFHVQIVERPECHLRSACPSPRRCRPCGWRSPIHCRTRSSPRRICRPSPWSGRARSWTRPDCG